MAFYARRAAKAGDFEAGIESGLTAILSSTKFLFRAEPLPITPHRPLAGAAVVAVDDLSLASRLSFLMWSEGPDDAADRARPRRGS